MDQTACKPATPKPATLDCDYILTHAGGDPDLLLRLCAGLLDELPHRTAAVEAALQKGSGIERAAQQLRNSLEILGPGRHTYTAETFTLAVRDGRSRQMQSEWRHLKRELAELIPQLQRLILEVSSPRSPVQ